MSLRRLFDEDLLRTALPAFRQMSRMMEDGFMLPTALRAGASPSGLSSLLPNMSSFMPRCDIKETAKNYVISAELPGFRKEDIDVSVEGNALKIKAEMKEERGWEQPEGGEPPASADQHEAASLETSATEKGAEGSTAPASTPGPGSKALAKKGKGEEENVHLSEIVRGTYMRSFTLPEDANPGSIKASHRDGILTLKIDKLADHLQSKRVAIE